VIVAAALEVDRLLGLTPFFHQRGVDAAVRGVHQLDEIFQREIAVMELVTIPAPLGVEPGPAEHDLVAQQFLQRAIEDVIQILNGLGVGC